jgi:hypothetical protein
MSSSASHTGPPAIPPLAANPTALDVLHWKRAAQQFARRQNVALNPAWGLTENLLSDGDYAAKFTVPATAGSPAVEAVDADEITGQTAQAARAAIPPTAAFLPPRSAKVAPASLPANATSAAVARFNAERADFATYHNALTVLTDAIITSLGVSHCLVLGQTRTLGVSEMTVLEIIDAATAHWPLTAGAIDAIKTQCGVPMNALSFDVHAVTLQRIFTDFEAVGYRLPESDRLTLLASSIRDYPPIVNEFHMYKRQHPALSAQTFAGACAYLLMQQPNWLPLVALGSPAATALSYASPSNTPLASAFVTAAPAPVDPLEPFRAVVAQLLAAQSTGPAPTSASGARSYCFHHGFTGHSGNNCNAMKDVTRFTDAMRKAKRPSALANPAGVVVHGSTRR